ncbi:DUF21 domain-containing protein [Zancudomyces culisetae]|uniref:DUF21 domain-containing protein n=1 Tax=Zancudomyces culisetae TaxID=1213189 RepID=A0A1R1PYR3_ZANCU|nr:DUF21 domain-containing protein [Zancudomyces culisetae]|eukprot:OMH86106.1 DUF21 domain-containing protein [Zancudomyces culisetae]
MVVDVMTDMNSVYMLEFNDTLNMKLINEIVDRGHSRIPVYKGKRSNIVGVLLVKSLILINPKECIKVGRLQLRQIPWVLTSVSLYDILNAFQEGGSHMAVVASAPSDESAVDMRNLDTNRAGLAMKMNESTPLNIGHRSSDAETSYASSKPKRTSSQFSAKISYKSEENWTPLGIITLEDVIEELIQEEIVDETDVFIDIKNKIKVARAISSAKLLPGTFSPHSITRNKSTTSYHKRSMLRNDSSRLQSGPACQSEINTESYGILVSQPEEQNSSSLGGNTPTFKV